MPRFFFHFVDHRKREPDVIGIEFSSLETAYLDAFAAAREIWREMLLISHDPTRCAFEIADESGLVLMDLPFLEVLEAAQRRGGQGRARRALHTRACRARRLSGELAAQIEVARASITRSREILQRPRTTQIA